MSQTVPAGRYSSIPGSGWLILIVVGICLLPAYGLSISLLFLMAAMFLGMLLYNAISSTLSMTGLNLTLRDTPRLYAGRPETLRIKLQNEGTLLGAGYLTIKLLGQNLGHEPVRHTWLSANKQAEIEIPVVPKHRGKCHLLGIEVVTAYPFGLFNRHVLFGVDRDLIAFPAALDNEAGFLNAKSNEPGALPRSSDDYQYLAPYRAGDDVRRIHWRKSTLIDNPVLRRDLTNPQSFIPRLFVPDPCPNFEFAVSLMATHFYTNEFGEGWAVVTEDGIQETGDLEEMLTFLALVKPLSSQRAAEDFEHEGFRPIFASDLTPEGAP